MEHYRPTTKAYEVGHKLTRQAVYALTETGGLAYPNGVGGFNEVDAVTVAQWCAEEWLEPCETGESAIQASSASACGDYDEV